MKTILKTIFYLAVLLSTASNSSAQCWNLVWADEFNGFTFDATKWTPQTGAGGWGNNELQYYTARPENIEVSNGSLKIIARSETYNGSNYTSARLRSINKGDWTYGKFEARIKMPAAQGLWPAFWMMPTENYYGTHPQAGNWILWSCLACTRRACMGRFIPSILRQMASSAVQLSIICLLGILVMIFIFFQ